MLIQTPRFLDLELTNDCNLRCKYCYHFGSAGDVNGDLSTSEWLAFFNELGRCGVMSVSLSGGEPLLRHDFPELVESVVHNRMRFSIVTNATLVNRELVRLLALTNQCEMIYVSLDGANAYSHDYCRGEGSFARTIAGLSLIREANLPVAVRVTVHKHNYSDLYTVAKFALDDLGVDYFSANMASYLGLCKENAGEVILNTQERSQAIIALFEIRKAFGEKVLNFGLVSDTNSWITMRQDYLKKNKTENGGCLSGCGGLFDTIAVRADGKITPCVQLNHIVLGRINQDDLTDIWQNHPLLNRVRMRRQIRLSSFEYCEGCEYLEVCRGGCPGLTYSVMGEENHPGSETCLRAYLRDGGKLPNV